MKLFSATHDTPVGPFTTIVDDDVVVAAGFVADPGELHARLVSRRRQAPLQELDDLGEVSAALAGYLGGELHALDGLPVAQQGAPFLRAAWDALRRVEPGTTVSYQQLAVLAGAPGAARAAGTACARNPVALIVPCHRVVRADGTLGGYAYGLERKRWLLRHEQAPIARG